MERGWGGEIKYLLGMLIHILKAMAVWNVWNVPGEGGEGDRAIQPMKEKTSCSPPSFTPQGTHPALGAHSRPLQASKRPFSKVPNPDKNTRGHEEPLSLSPWPRLSKVRCYLVSFRPKALGATQTNGLSSSGPWATHPTYKHLQLQPGKGSAEGWGDPGGS